MSLEEIKNTIKIVVEKYIHVYVEDEEQSLIDIEVPVEDFLYVVNELEIVYGLPVIQVLENNNHQVFSIKNLAKKLYESMM